MIDANYAVVGRKRRILAAIGRGLLWMGVAALIGFLVPPLWVLIETIGAKPSSD